MFLSNLFIYPIKSLGEIELKNSTFEKRGLTFDRRFMLVDSDNNFITQRQFPKMSVIKTDISNNSLIVNIENEILELSLNFEIENTNSIKVKVWDSICDAIEMNTDISNIFSNFLNTECKLVLMPNSTNRNVSSKYDVTKDGIVSFADGYPFLLVNKSSLDDLNSKSSSYIPMDRFRPNLVIENALPFEEDSWKKIKIGKHIFYVVKPCERCVVTTIDQKLGKSFDKEPLKTLSTYRKIDGKVIFGQNVISESNGYLEIGDKVEILN